MSELILGNGVWVVNLVAKDNEWDLLKLLHGEKSIELSLGLWETLVVLGVNEEDYTRDLWEVIFPQTAGCKVGVSYCLAGKRAGLLLHTLLMATEIEGCELDVTDSELLRSYIMLDFASH